MISTHSWACQQECNVRTVHTHRGSRQGKIRPPAEIQFPHWSHPLAFLTNHTTSTGTHKTTLHSINRTSFTGHTHGRLSRASPTVHTGSRLLPLGHRLGALATRHGQAVEVDGQPAPRVVRCRRRLCSRWCRLRGRWCRLKAHARGHRAEAHRHTSLAV